MKYFYTVFWLGVVVLFATLIACSGPKAPADTYSGGCIVGGSTLVFTGATFVLHGGLIEITQDENVAVTGTNNCFFIKDAR